jgi:exopolyphosphatase / guanosine-5'-triphosphate,3'-diphosphate pyrophosphatase
MRVAVIDLGSSSFRLVVAEATDRGRIKHRTRKREDISLGLAVGRDGWIGARETKETLAAAARLRRRAAREDVDHLIVVATSALRDAENGDDVRERLERRLGRPVRLLSGHEEAALTFAAIARSTDLGSGPVLTVDLGGGSLEVATGRSGELDRRWTLPLGAARLTGRLVRHDPMTADERDRVSMEVRKALRPVLTHGGHLPDVVAAGGSVKALARVLAGDERKPVGKSVLTTESLWSLRDHLVAATLDERLAMPGMAARRAQVIPAAAIVMTTLLSMLRVPTVTVSEWGVREGIILQAVGLVPETEVSAA